MSTFVNHLVDDLAIKAIPSSSSGDIAQVASSNNDKVKQTLRNVLLSLSPSISPNAVHESLFLLMGTVSCLSPASEKEEEGLKKAILGRLIVGVYGEALNTFLAEATHAESEAEWWDRIERSRMNLAWYLLQSMF
jgi:nuclear control of ATPase protein 2